MERIILYKDVVDVPATVSVGEEVLLVRGDGPREGEVMAHAIIEAIEPELRLRTLEEPSERER